jgi:pimeloyl-ACP methyl ester carboxylesterase
MEIRAVFLGRGGFKSPTEICNTLSESSVFDKNHEDIATAKPLLIFQTTQQQTWLVATKARLYCVLDDLPRSFTHVQWSIPASDLIENGIVKIEILTQSKNERTGLVSIGARRNWLYSKKLFVSRRIENQIKDLIRLAAVEGAPFQEAQPVAKAEPKRRRQFASRRRYFADLERKGATDFANEMKTAKDDNERALRIYFGDSEFNRMKELADAATRGIKKGNVVVLNGIMGSELSYAKDPQDLEGIWISIVHLLLGDFNLLPLEDDKRSLFPVEVSGILKSYYGKLILSLAANWNVHAFAFDWRKDIDEEADRLLGDVDNRFGRGEPAHFVAHSMGGLVVRAFIKRHRERWDKMWDSDSDHTKGGRLIMLGTPNWGSFAIPMLYFGLNSILDELAKFGRYNGTEQLLHTAKTFVGTYQMLPSPRKVQRAEAFFDPSIYVSLHPLPRRLKEAREFQDEISDVSDPARMVYVAGANQSTVVGVNDWNKLGSRDSYRTSPEGDGTVPHALGFLDGVPNYFVNEEHSNLPRNEDVIAALGDLLATGETKKLPDAPPPAPRGIVAGVERIVEDAVAAAETAVEAIRGDEFKRVADSLQAGGRDRGEYPEFGDDDRAASSKLMRGLMRPA